MIGSGRLQIPHPESSLAYDCFWRWPLMYTAPSITVSRSPGTATTRLMKFVSDRCRVGRGHALSLECSTPHTFDSAPAGGLKTTMSRSEEHTSELQSRQYLVCRLLLEKKKNY